MKWEIEGELIPDLGVRSRPPFESFASPDLLSGGTASLVSVDLAWYELP